ncbi:hypothetical protein VTN77DRAFT_8143 [Rasamsonia byssochlamydoides]|uniref:uncharacterized protein n=1 Tax=Rasamsonia byssochlamydoides TaxID=89139 RepID=UPI0037441085
MLRARPTRISLTDSEVLASLERIALERTLISEIEQLEVGNPLDFEDDGPWCVSSRHPSSVETSGSDCGSCTERITLGSAGEHPALGETPPVIQSVSTSSETYCLGGEGHSPHVPIVTSPLLHAGRESDSQTSSAGHCHSSSFTVASDQSQDQMSTGALSSYAQGWPLPGQRFEFRRSVGTSSSGTVVGSFESAHEKSDSVNSLQLARREQDGQYVAFPSKPYYTSMTGLDLALPRTFFSVSYFPTVYERTRIIGSPDSEVEKDELSDLTTLESGDTPTSSLLSDDSTSDLTASIIRSGSSSSETNIESDFSDVESTLSSLDDKFLKSTLGSDMDIDLRERIIEESTAFCNAFNSLVAQLGNENDSAEDFGLCEVRNRPLGVWYRRRRHSFRRSALVDRFTLGGL